MSYDLMRKEINTLKYLNRKVCNTRDHQSVEAVFMSIRSELMAPVIHSDRGLVLNITGQKYNYEMAAERQDAPIRTAALISNCEHANALNYDLNLLNIVPDKHQHVCVVTVSTAALAFKLKAKLSVPGEEKLSSRQEQKTLESD